MSRISNLSSRIFVGGLNQAVDEVDLEKAFKLFGEITNVMVMRDRENGRSRGFAFISFKDPQSSEEAISRMHGVEIRGKCVSVRHAERTKYDKTDDHRSNDVVKLNSNRSSAGTMHSQLSYERRNFRPSDRVYVTPDDDQESFSKNSGSDHEMGRFRGHSPNKSRTAGDYGQNSRLPYFPERKGFQRGYLEGDDGLSSDRLQDRPFMNDRYRNDDEMSPAREIHDYINSRGKSLSPLLQQLTASADERELRRGGFSRSFRSDARRDADSYRGDYLDRQRSDDRQSRRITESDRNRTSPRGRHAFRQSPSPRLKGPPSPDLNRAFKRRHDMDSSSREYPSRKNVRTSPMSRRATRPDKRALSRSPVPSPPLNREWVQSHDINYKGRTLSHRPGNDVATRHRNYGGQFRQDFNSNARNDNQGMRRRQGEDSDSRRDNWKTSGMQRDRRRSPPGDISDYRMQHSEGKRTRRDTLEIREQSSQRWGGSPRQNSTRHRLSVRNASPDSTRNWDKQKFPPRGRSPPRRTQVAGRRY